LTSTPHALKLPGQPQAVTRGVNQAHEGQQRATAILVTTALRAVKAAARRFAVQCLYIRARYPSSAGADPTQRRAVL